MNPRNADLNLGPDVGGCIPLARPIISSTYAHSLRTHPRNFAFNRRWDRRYGVGIDSFATPKVGQVVRLLPRAHLDMDCIDFRGFLVVVTQKPLKLSEAHLPLVL